MRTFYSLALITSLFLMSSIQATDYEPKDWEGLYLGGFSGYASSERKGTVVVKTENNMHMVTLGFNYLLGKR